MSTWVTGTTVVENSVNAETMTSNVTITLIVGWNGGSWAGDSPYYYINVNGSRKKSGNANFNTGQATSGSQTIATWTGDVPHNADGTGSMTWDVGYEGIYAGEGRYSTASGTKTLTTIVVDDSNRFLDKAGLTYFWSKLKSFFVAKETGKGLSTNDFTTAEKNKLSGIASGAEVNQNAFSNVKVGSTTIGADSKTDTLEIVAGSNITLTPDATNDKLTITATDTIYTPASANPLMDGTVAVGTSVKYAREDHRHPTDTSRYAKPSGGIPKTDLASAVQTSLGKADTAVQDANYVHTDNNFTTAEKTKLSGIESGAEVNVIESIALNGTDQTITNKAVDLELVTSVNGQTGDVIVEGGEGGGTSNNMVMLWSNPNTSVAFANQTVTLSESVDNFDCILVDCAFGVETNLGHHSNVCVPSASSHWALFAGKTTPYVSGRSVDFSGTSATFGQGWLMDNNWQSNNNGYCIPLKVYGINIKGVGKSGQLELAWSNPSPTASFASQTITLKDNYPVVFVVSTYSASDDITSKNGTVSTIISGYRGQVIAWNENMTWTYGRSCVLNGSSLAVGDARWLIQNSSASAIQNDACVPKFVFGLKTVAPKVGKTLLWTNPNPTSNFSAQTVTLANDANQYDMLMVESRYGATEDSISSSFLEPTVTTRQTVMSARYVVNATTTIVMRDATINGTQITFTTGRYIVPSGMGEGTQYAIPLKIYGINFSGASSLNYYTAGDTYSIPTALQADTSMSLIIGSHVTDGGKRCDFTVYLPKSMEHVTPSVTSLRMNGRTTGGAYMNFSGSQSHVTNGFETVGASGYTISLTKITDYALTISVTRSGGYGATNNTPVSLEINQLSLSFA